MRLAVDTTSETPVYRQLRDRVVEAIAQRELVDGDRLPPTRRLAEELGINFHTVNKAYARLSTEGFVRLTRRSGAVVTRRTHSRVDQDWQDRERVLLAEAVARGVPAGEVLRRCAALLDSFPDDPET